MVQVQMWYCHCKGCRCSKGYMCGKWERCEMGYSFGRVYRCGRDTGVVKGTCIEMVKVW